MWEVTLETQQSEVVANKILARATKPELAQYLNTTLFIPTAASLLKEIKNGFLKTWPDLTEMLIKNNIETSGNTTMGHLHMRRQELQSTREKPPYTELEDQSKTNVLFLQL